MFAHQLSLCDNHQPFGVNMQADWPVRQARRDRVAIAIKGDQKGWRHTLARLKKNRQTPLVGASARASRPPKHLQRSPVNYRVQSQPKVNCSDLPTSRSRLQGLRRRVLLTKVDDAHRGWSSQPGLSPRPLPDCRTQAQRHDGSSSPKKRAFTSRCLPRPTRSTAVFMV